MMTYRTIIATLLLTFSLSTTNPSFGWRQQPELESVTNATQKSDRLMAHGSIMIAWSETNDELRGTSNKMGQWENLKIEQQATITPILADTVAAVRMVDSIAAYSGETGSWDWIALAKDSTATISMHKDFILLEGGEHVYTFYANFGVWTSPTDPDLQPMEAKYRFPKTRGKIFNDLTLWLSSLPKNKVYDIESSRSDIVGEVDANGSMKPVLCIQVKVRRKRMLDELAAKLGELNESAIRQEKMSLGSVADNLTSPAVDPPPGIRESLAHDNPVNLIPHLKAKVSDLENQAIEMGKSLTAGTSPTDKVRRTLEELVTKSFDTRQELQSLEAIAMRAKLEKVEENLSTRQKLRSRIIEQRVLELLERVTAAVAGHDALSAATLKLESSSETRPQSKSLESTKAEETKREGNTTSIQIPSPGAVQTIMRTSEFAKILQKNRDRIEDCEKAIAIYRSRIQSLSDEMAKNQANESQIEGDRRMIDSKNYLKANEKEIENWMTDWKRDWSEYQSQLRLLRFDVEEAESNLSLKNRKADLYASRYRMGTGTELESADSKSDLNIAQFRLSRANELYSQYASLEKSDPQLNPDSYKPKTIDPKELTPGR